MAFAVAIFAPLAPLPAGAAEPVAVGLPADLDQEGCVPGVTYNCGNRDDSGADVPKECLPFIDAPDSPGALCKLCTHFENQCFSVSMGPEAGA